MNTDGRGWPVRSCLAGWSRPLGALRDSRRFRRRERGKKHHAPNVPLHVAGPPRDGLAFGDAARVGHLPQHEHRVARLGPVEPLGAQGFERGLPAARGRNSSPASLRPLRQSSSRSSRPIATTSSSGRRCPMARRTPGPGAFQRRAPLPRGRRGDSVPWRRARSWNLGRMEAKSGTKNQTQAKETSPRRAWRRASSAVPSSRGGRPGPPPRSTNPFGRFPRGRGSSAPQPSATRAPGTLPSIPRCRASGL
jgi:hypothetical protein